LGILSLLENAAEDLSGKLIGLYSYGSGSSGEFFAARITTDYRNTLSGTHHKSMLTLREEISVAEYEDFYRYKTEQITGLTSGKFYLKEFDNNQRIYGQT
jgi:hydroxymethylglutaryl-CoA synthase